MKRFSFAIIAIAAVLVSCSKDDSTTSTPDAASSYVTIDPMISTRATDLNFETGDMIGLSIIMDSDNSSFVENSPLTYSGTSFSSDLIWYSDIDATSTLVAYYPYVAGDSTPTSFTVAADQTATGAYTASDLMGAVKSNVLPDYTTTMTFSHLLSRVVVNVDNQTVYKISSIEIGGSYPTASFDAAAMTAVVDESSTPITISAPLWSDDSYKAVIVPQTVALSFTVTLNDGSVITRDKAEVTFLAGKEYTADITLVAGDVIVDISGDAYDWEEGGSIPDKDPRVIYFAEYDDYFEYGFEDEYLTYQIATLSNGATWMTEPLCFIPEGYTPSTDASISSHIWYPYGMDYAALVEADAVALTPSINYVVNYTDAETIKAKGYLYDMTAALGEAVTESNYNTFEGAQGICPDGWHIPTRADYLALVGYSNKAADESAAVVDATAVAYDSSYNGAKISLMDEAGFNYVYSGYRNFAGYLSTTTPYFMRTMLQSSNTTLTDIYGELALNYYMTSTAYQTSYSNDVLSNIQFFGLMSTFSSSAYPEGRLTLAYISESSGQALRCVKDAE